DEEGRGLLGELAGEDDRRHEHEEGAVLRGGDTVERRVRVMTTAEIGVFGGSGFYAFLDDPEEIVVDTPYGKPAAAVTVGSIGGRRVAFIPRHGKDHEFPPHRVPYRANLWAMKELGVTRVFGPSAAGSLRRDIPPRTFDVIGMTQFPEAALAKELELCFANVALVTDYDVGVDGIAPVSHADVLKVFGENLDKLRDLLFAAIPRVPEDRSGCDCAHALGGS